MSRLREEAGMTIMEVLVACTVGMIVLTAMFGLLDSTVRMNTNVMRKTDAMQRGRIAMDVLTQELRSQVCLPNLQGTAVIAGAADYVEFYSDFTDGTGNEPLTKRRLAMNPTTGDITTSIFTTTRLTPRPTDFTATPTIIQKRLENAALTPRAGGGQVPFLQYYAYRWVGNPPRPEPIEPLTPPLDNTEVRRVARVDINFVSQPTGVEDVKKGVHLSDQIMARHSDPNLARWDPANPTLPDPRCV